MIMLIFEDDRRPFSYGASQLAVLPFSEKDKFNRIFITIEIHGITTQAYSDTGGVYFLCPPWISEEMNLDPNNSLGDDNINFRKDSISGNLHRMPVTLVAERMSPGTKNT